VSADLVIRGGTVVDGSGAPGVTADVAIDGDRIVGVGPDLATKGARVLDAEGCVVAPGLIDVHTHYDAQVFWDGALTPSCHHGVTSVVMGNCGYSIVPIAEEHVTPMVETMEQVEDMDPACLLDGVPWDELGSFADYRAAIERRGTALNLTGYVGHTAVRIAAMGLDAFSRRATDDEISTMCELVDQSIEAGACGFASSFAPTHSAWQGNKVPSRSATVDEVSALCHRVGAHGHGMIEFAVGEMFSFEEIYALQRDVGVPITYGALIAMEGLTPELLAIHRDEQAKGSNVWPQVTPRPITFQFDVRSPFGLTQAPCFSELIGQSDDERRRRFSDARWRGRARVDLDETMVPIQWDKTTVDETTVHTDLVGRDLAGLASERGVHPLDILLDLSVAENLRTRFRIVLINDHDPSVRQILAADHVALSFTDAGAHVGMLCDAHMHTEVLSRWVRDEGVLTMEQAIKKMTGELADAWQLTDRGHLRPGAFADVYVFDPETLDPGPVRRVCDFPADTSRLVADQPSGVRHVVVNGTPITTDGQSVAADLTTAERPGRWLVPGGN